MIEHAIPATLLALLTPFAGVFSRPGFENFQALLVGWILCPGRHTISRVILLGPSHRVPVYGLALSVRLKPGEGEGFASDRRQTHYPRQTRHAPFAPPSFVGPEAARP